MAVFRPTGGVPPYTLALERVGPEGSIVYNPETELLEFPMGLNENDPVTGVMVVTDAENNRAELPFRIISSSTAPLRSFRSSLRSRLGWLDGYGNGSTLTVNMRDTNTIQVPLLNKPGARLTVTDASIPPTAPPVVTELPDTPILNQPLSVEPVPTELPDTPILNQPLSTEPPFFLSADQRTIVVSPLWLSGVTHKDILLSAEKDGERTSLILRLEAGRPFAFLGGHGYNARYTLNGVTDLASISVPHANYFQGPVTYRIEVSDEYAVNAVLAEGATDNQIVFSSFSDNATITYKASNGTDTIEIRYDLRTATAQKPDVPPEGGELRQGVSKTTNVLPVSRATASRAGLRPVMRWVDPCLDQVEEISYAIDASQTRIYLPEAISNTNDVRYEIEPLGTSPSAQYEASGHSAVLPSGPRELRYRLTAISGAFFISKNILVEIDPALRGASPDYIAACDEQDAVQGTYVTPTQDTGAGEVKTLCWYINRERCASQNSRYFGTRVQRLDTRRRLRRK